MHNAALGGAAGAARDRAGADGRDLLGRGRVVGMRIVTAVIR